MLDLRDAFDLATRNISRWGDTDVFPFAPENHILHDRRDAVVDLLLSMHSDLEQAIITQPVVVEDSLALVTYEGFRWVTQLDPVWNAYFLGLVLRLSPEIEAARLPPDRNIVYSYRVEIEDSRSSLFSDGAWAKFDARSAELAHEYPYVVVCDIADFYSRVYHHRLDNALRLLRGVGDEPSRLERLLREFSGGPSYGLPVGGPASRILAELALNRTDRLLVTNGIMFTRYADDYRLFSSTRNDAFRSLVLLSEVLHRNEGLTLQRQKTRVLQSKDFLRSPLFVPEDSDELTTSERRERRFLGLSLRYDPYSPTAEEDYDRLKASLEEFDILGMLTQEVNKSRINVPVVRRLAQTIVHLEPQVRDLAAQTLVGNLEVLAPALPVVLRALEELLPVLSDDVAAQVSAEIRRAIRASEYFLDVAVNRAYALRVLWHNPDEENVALCTELFDVSPPFIKRDIVYLMHSWHADYWLSDKRRQWMGQHAWVKRALLLASYSLGDEGRHWRRAIAERLSPFDIIARDWMRDRVQQQQYGLPM